MKATLLTLLILSPAMALAQLATAPKPSIGLYQAGLAEGIVIQPNGARCIVLRSYDAPQPERNKQELQSLKADGYYGTASGTARLTDSFCYDAAQRLIHYNAVARDAKGLRPMGNYDAQFENTDTGDVQRITFPDLPGTTVTTLFRNQEPVWSQTYGRGMLAVQEQYTRSGNRTEVMAKSFIMPWHLKRVEERQPDGGMLIQRFMPQGPDTNGSIIEYALYNSRQQVLSSCSLKPRRVSGQYTGIYDTSVSYTYQYDKEHRLTRVGDVLQLKYTDKDAWPDDIIDSTKGVKTPTHWRIRYNKEGDQLREVLVYERRKLPKATKGGAYYFELKSRYELNYPKE
ncbi:MAG: hypothetical protein JST06_08140 [Bacteroidetes bacterium]|nr:hypothetical protein [Bacteroidota bacterium]MBS1628715.1 hypothetical protein [Bacteroidota bacterium]